MEVPPFILELSVLLETLDVPCNVVNDDSLLSVDSDIGRDNMRRLILTFKRESPILEELKNNKHCMGYSETEELVSYFDKSKVIKDSTDANGLISTKHYYGPVTKILLK